MPFSIRPRSLTRLALAGFSLVVLPLLLIIGAAALYVDRLALQSDDLITRSVRIARLGEELEDRILNMERNARQYQVLGDISLVELTSQRRAELAQIVGELEQLQKGAAARWRLDQMREDSLLIVNALRRESPRSPALGHELARFDRMRELSTEIRRESDAYLSNSSTLLRNTASEAQRFLILMAVTMIPLVVLLVLFFTLLITRPMQQIQAAIGNLGRRTFRQPILIEGPTELAALGERLEWLRERLIKLEEEKNLFLRRMSHELKTPLASLREGSELFLDGTAGPLSETQMEIAGILRTNSMELQFLIENLLDYEEWREKSGELRISRFAFRPLVEATLLRHRLTIGTKHLRIEQQYADFELHADRDRIRIAFDNLISNAVKFTPPGGSVYIRAAAGDGAGATIEVADTGPGIPVTERDRIFEPFYQGPSVSDGHLRGTGIGLTIVRDCVAAHAGSIEIVEGEYSGAHFRIRLPAAKH